MFTRRQPGLSLLAAAEGARREELGSAGRGAHWLRKGLEAEVEGKSLLQVVRERK